MGYFVSYTSTGMLRKEPFDRLIIALSPSLPLKPPHPLAVGSITIHSPLVLLQPAKAVTMESP